MAKLKCGEPQCLTPTVKHGGDNVMVWGCMAASGQGKLHFIDENYELGNVCGNCPESDAAISLEAHGALLHLLV